MKQSLLWIALIIALITAAWFATLHFRTMSNVLQQSIIPGPLSARHAYLANRCAACHDPTMGVRVAKCTACHANSERLLGRQPTAFHASVQECSACHIEHQTGTIRPLVMDHVVLAQLGARTLKHAALQDSDSAATLTSLNTWLKIKHPAQFDTASALRTLNCAGCHDRKDAHFKRFGSDCAQCHGLTSWSIALYQHPSSESKDCVQCHQPPPSHFMGHFSMISQTIAHKEHARVDECFECHNTTGWNDIVDVGFYKHH